MLGLDPEGPIPMDVLCIHGAPSVEWVKNMWEKHGKATPVSGDPHFKPKQYKVKAIRPATQEEIDEHLRKKAERA